LENLKSAGKLGLVEAARHFDPSRQVEFASYAAFRIRGAVIDELRRNCPLPQHMLQRVGRVRKARQQLPAHSTVDDLSIAAGLSHRETLECLAAMQLTRPIRLDRAHETTCPVADEPAKEPDAVAERNELKRILQEAIQELPERARLVVTLYYSEELLLKEIGQVLGLSEARVCRILNATLDSLRNSLLAKDQ